MENEQSEFDFITNSAATTDTISIGPDSYSDYLTEGSRYAVTGNMITTSSSDMQLKSSVEDIQNRLVTIEKRLGVLVPDEKLLEQYEILQSLYNQYTAAEALLYDGENNE
jgi:TPP-dependent indolepyruvate ferredoxin oxidoreductase alpha subunit